MIRSTTFYWRRHRWRLTVGASRLEVRLSEEVLNDGLARAGRHFRHAIIMSIKIDSNRTINNNNTEIKNKQQNNNHLLLLLSTFFNQVISLDTYKKRNL